MMSGSSSSNTGAATAAGGTGATAEPEDAPSAWKPIEVIALEFSANIRGIGVSIINATPKELLYVTVEKISATYSNSNLNQALELQVGKMQIDNQQFEGNSHIPPSQRRALSHGTWYTFPVMLSSALLPDKPFLHVSFVKSNLYKDIAFYRYFSAALQEVHLTLDRTLLEDIVAFAEEMKTSVTEGESKQPNILKEYVMTLP
jgi:vacuolar protein sorting-associated protein 13D